MIDDLLDVTRITRGKIEIHHAAIDVHQLLHNVMQITQNDILENRIELAIELNATHHYIWADPVRIQQVFWNLLNNAVKFTPTEGRIKIRSSNEGDQFVFEISDSGIGIEPEQQSRIFEAFDQGERSITRRFGGLGLGFDDFKKRSSISMAAKSVCTARGKTEARHFEFFSIFCASLCVHRLIRRTAVSQLQEACVFFWSMITSIRGVFSRGFSPDTDTKSLPLTLCKAP